MDATGDYFNFSTNLTNVDSLQHLHQLYEMVCQIKPRDKPSVVEKSTSALLKSAPLDDQEFLREYALLLHELRSAGWQANLSNIAKLTLQPPQGWSTIKVETGQAAAEDTIKAIIEVLISLSERRIEAEESFSLLSAELEKVNESDAIKKIKRTTLILRDLALQGWRIKYADKEIFFKNPFIKRAALEVKFKDQESTQKFCQFCRFLIKSNRGIDLSEVDKFRAQLSRKAPATQVSPRLEVYLTFVSQLWRQGWEFEVNENGTLFVNDTNSKADDLMIEKERVRQQELIKRDEQLSIPSVRKFVTEMEHGIVYHNKKVSIVSLFRDGRELASSIRKIRSAPKAQRAGLLSELINPYIQFVDDTTRCSETGLRLQDIWRYFRHTWSNQYSTTPGRTLSFLVRDKGAEHHPVIGIGSIGSAVVQLRDRDEWIGWQSEKFIEDQLLLSSDSDLNENAGWLHSSLNRFIDELYIEDFIAEGMVSSQHLDHPNPEIISSLRCFGDEQRELHRKFADKTELKRSTQILQEQLNFVSTPKDNNIPSLLLEDVKSDLDQSKDIHAEGDSFWENRAKTFLFRGKRAKILADLLECRAQLERCFGEQPDADGLRRLLGSSKGVQAIRKILRQVKGERVGIAIADINVCGSIAPYNALLGGKLVSLLAASPLMVRAYQTRYADQVSEIASAMAGRPVNRPAELVFLGTTSLYGAGASQYNRIKMPAELIGGRVGESLGYFRLGKSESFGTSHFSDDTIDELMQLVTQPKSGQKRVNGIFGEGVNPKFRRLREAFEELKLNPDTLLQHGRNRIIYGVPLARNFRAYLQGKAETPDYIFDTENPQIGTQRMIDWWVERWLSKRVDSDEVLAKVESNALVFPLKKNHGARVNLPELGEPQANLFDE